MEFPDLGKHCSVNSCKQLDFLPVKCDACRQIFCKEHFSYSTHNCTESYKKDNQVPVCPLCNTPVPVRKGEPPDLRVGQHIDNDCDSDPAKQRRKASKNRCTMEGCKKKELIPFTCARCKRNFCIKHRLEEDHKCQDSHPTSSAGAAALSRLQSGAASLFKPSRTTQAQPTRSHQQAPQTRQATLTNMGFGRELDRDRRERTQGRPGATQVQGNLSEDEAMAQAIAASLQSAQPTQSSSQTRALTRQEEEDEALARALQLSEQEARRRTQPNSNKETKCLVS